MIYIYRFFVCLLSFLFIACGKEEQKKEIDYSFEIKETFDIELYNRARNEPGLKITEDFNFSFEVQSKEEGLEYEIWYDREAEILEENGTVIEKSTYYPLKDKKLKFRYKPKTDDFHRILVRFRNKNNKDQTQEKFYEIRYYQNLFQVDLFSKNKSQDERKIYQGSEEEIVFKIKTQHPKEDFFIKFEDDAIEPKHEKSSIKFDDKSIEIGQWIKIPNIDKFRIKLISWIGDIIDFKFSVKNSTSEILHRHRVVFSQRKIRLADNFNFQKTITKQVGEELSIFGKVYKTEKISNKVWVTTSVVPNTNGIETFSKKEIILTDEDDFILNIPTYKTGIYNYTIVIEDEFGNKTEKTFENIKVQQNDFKITLHPKQTHTYVGGYLPIEYNLGVLDNDTPNETNFSFTFNDKGNGGYIVFEKTDISKKYRAGEIIPIRPNVADFYYVSPQHKGNKTIDFIFKSGENIKPVISIQQEFIGELFSVEIRNEQQRMKVNQYYPITISLRTLNGVHQSNISYEGILNKKSRYRGKVYNVGEKIELEFPNTNIEIFEEDNTNNIYRREQTEIQATVRNTTSMENIGRKNILLFRPFTISGFEYSLKVEKCASGTDFSIDYGGYNSTGKSQKEKVKLFFYSNDILMSDDMNNLSGIQLEFEFKNERDNTNVEFYSIDIQEAIRSNLYGKDLFLNMNVCRRFSENEFAVLDKPLVIKARKNGYVIWQAEVPSWINSQNSYQDLDGSQKYYIRLENKEVILN